MARFLLPSCAFLGFVLTAWIGCGSGGGAGAPSGTEGAGGMQGSTTTGSGAAAGTSTGGSGGSTPIFETDIVPIFNKSCGAGDNACHSSVAYAATKDQGCRGWLALEDAPLGSQIYGGPNDGTSTGCQDRTLYERLTELDAWQTCGPLKRYIVPCDVGASYLFDKIDDGPYCGEAPGKMSEPMPKGKAMDPSERELIRAWILAGTPRANGDVVDCGGGSGGAGSGGGGPSGQAPVPDIFHPGDMENRESNKPIPFIGVATDAEDGELSGASLVWTSSLSGVIGTGKQFDAPLSAGTHVITLTATDSDKNTGKDSITLFIQ